MIIFAIVAYYIILWIKRTKAWNLLKGAAVLLAVYALAKLTRLDNISFLFEKMAPSILLAAIIVLQPELRKALEQLGNRNILSGIISASSDTKSGLTAESIDALVRASEVLSANKVGALIVIERTITLTEYIETGIRTDAVITSSMLEQIFEKNTPLHDGAVIIRNNRIEAATCYLPLSQNNAISKELGTRHRAGLGISEVSDAITIIVSEETGSISIALDGTLTRDIQHDRLREALFDIRTVEKPQNSLGAKIKQWTGRRKNEKQD
ncbi:MAG: diadenylate cyclase CdaA [Lachnospiraceae bacterium]|nr:diadenylate cyclase CdaA [Lachnospiraceae bacterium]